MALESPASHILRDLDTTQTQAYQQIWEALALRFCSLDGTREAMRRFDARRQDENDTIPDFEIKGRQFANASGQSRTKKKVCIIDTHAK